MTADRTSSTAKRGRPSAGHTPLEEVAEFGANPGALRMLAYAPAGLKAGSPLVVVLHGCTQTAAGYDAHAGWTALADELGFAVLYPEQTSANNPRVCFNWFLLADSARGLGETRSIREMVDAMIQRHKIDRGRIFVTGLSAGGAMTAALLKDYPEVFAAGAVIAGLPCGVAANVQEAYQAMTRPAERSAEELGDSVRTGSPHIGPWPRVAIWHGTADKTVAPKNADELAKQWVDVHDGDLGAFREDRLDGQLRRVWAADGRDVIEQIMIEGMGHGAPLDRRLGETPGPFMLDAGVSSTRRIAAFFGLGGAEDEPRPVPRPRAARPRADAPGRDAAQAPQAAVTPPAAPAAPENASWWGRLRGALRDLVSARQSRD